MKGTNTNHLYSTQRGLIGSIPLSQRVMQLTSKINDLHATIERTKQERLEDWEAKAEELAEKY
jgi:hypothetical protein